MDLNTSAKILVVDDDRSLRALLRLALEEDAYQVFEAKNGEQCLSEYHLSQPDLILLDGIMPEMDGFTCCQRLRTLNGSEGIPILMVTVLDDQDSIDQAFAVGATDYITKPIHWGVLSQRVRALLLAAFSLKQARSTSLVLEKNQKWEDIIRDILHQRDSLENILTKIRDFWQLEGVYYSFNHRTSSSIVSDFCSLPSEFWTKLNLELQPLNSPVFTQAQLSPTLSNILNQRQINSFFAVPLEQKYNSRGFFTGYTEKKLDLSLENIQKLLDVSKLLSIQDD